MSNQNFRLQQNQRNAIQIVEDSAQDQHRTVFVQSHQSLSWDNVELLQDICEMICLEFFAQNNKRFSLFFVGENTLVIILYDWRDDMATKAFLQFLLQHLQENMRGFKLRAEAYQRIPALNILVHLKLRFEENKQRYTRR